METTQVKVGFVAINTIHCHPSYCARFECLFCTRARRIDTMPGFFSIQVLKPQREGEPYLIVSQVDGRSNVPRLGGLASVRRGPQARVRGYHRSQEAWRGATDDLNVPDLHRRHGLRLRNEQAAR